VVPLFADAFISPARQWVIRQGTWKVTIAAIAGLLYISIVMVVLSPIP
jgi:hypothetical protein